VQLGWSDSGQGRLRATNADRAAVVRILDIGQDEGRLDSVEHARRRDAAQAAKVRGELAALTADLPDRRGVREWIDPARVRGGDRERAVGWLAEGAAQGRLTAAEVERRAAALSGVSTYAELRPLLRGLPGWPGAEDKELLAGTADREAALTRLTEALIDGRVRPAEHPGLEADIGQARRVGDLEALLADLAARLSDQKRHDAVAKLTAAHRDGRLDVTEHTSRIARTQEAATAADLAQLTRDLHGNVRRLSQAERDDIAGRLKRALDEGRLDLAEYESRLQTAYAAATIAETAPLFADLVDPPRPPRRGPLDRIFDRVVANSALLPAPRHWWQRLFPKPAWKVLNVGTLLIYVYLCVPWDATEGTFIWGTLALFFLLGVYQFMALLTAELTGGTIEERQRAVIDDLQSRLRRHHNASIRAVEIEYEDGTAKVVIKNSSDRVPAPIIEEAVRLLWLSRLYPLHTIYLYSHSLLSKKVRLRRERKRLRHRYGPRPYGPQPPDAPKPAARSARQARPARSATTKRVR
jgi:hypothetical protein